MFFFFSNRVGLAGSVLASLLITFFCCTDAADKGQPRSRMCKDYGNRTPTPLPGFQSSQDKALRVLASFCVKFRDLGRKIRMVIAANFAIECLLHKPEQRRDGASVVRWASRSIKLEVLQGRISTRGSTVGIGRGPQFSVHSSRPVFLAPRARSNRSVVGRSARIPFSSIRIEPTRLSILRSFLF
jgi:hypothetical protein